MNFSSYENERWCSPSKNKNQTTRMLASENITIHSPCEFSTIFDSSNASCKKNAKPHTDPPNIKIVDAFIFNNELDLLYYRLNLLHNIVDYFIIVEATRTFTGKNKPLYYELHKNEERFAFFSNKIIHIIDDGLEKNPVVSQKDLLSRTNKYWQNEYKQRNSIDIGIKQLSGEPNGFVSKGGFSQKIKDNDYIIISDVDEIPNPVFLQNLKNSSNKDQCVSYYSKPHPSANTMFSQKTSSPEIMNLVQDLYYYNITCKVMEYWDFAKVLTYQCYKTKMESSPQKVRTIHQTDQGNQYIVEKGGWHLCYFETAENIKKKLESFSHQEFNNYIFSKIEYIRFCIENKKPLYNRSFDKIVYIPVKENTNLPPLHDTFFDF